MKLCYKNGLRKWFRISIGHDLTDRAAILHKTTAPLETREPITNTSQPLRVAIDLIKWVASQKFNTETEQLTLPGWYIIFKSFYSNCDFYSAYFNHSFDECCCGMFASGKKNTGWFSMSRWCMGGMTIIGGPILIDQHVNLKLFPMDSTGGHTLFLIDAIWRSCRVCGDTLAHSPLFLFVYLCA